MSHIHAVKALARTGVPRASGDEPFKDELDISDFKCSPRERG